MRTPAPLYGFNAVRIPLAIDAVLASASASSGPAACLNQGMMYDHNHALMGKSYLEVLAAQVLALTLALALNLTPGTDYST